MSRLETVQFLRGRASTDKPFFMIVGYLAPHFPLIVAGALLGTLQGQGADADDPTGLSRFVAVELQTSCGRDFRSSTCRRTLFAGAGSFITG